jgi:two-component sensor histidine kinase
VPALVARTSEAWRSAATILLCCTAAGVFFAPQVWIDHAYAGRALSGGRALAYSLAEWYVWAALSPVVVALARRFRFERGGIARFLLVHSPASVVLTVAKLMSDAAVVRSLTGSVRGPFTFLKVNIAFLTYWTIVALVHAVDHYRRSRERELRALQLQTELARAQVHALQLQLQPHFLFNTLNAIAALMREDVEAADLMLSRLAALLRITLDNADVQEVSLRQELEFLAPYLDIQKVRFGRRLTIEVDVAPDALEAFVPSLLLQPLVENAVRHGIGARPGPGTILVRAAIEAGVLCAQVHDDGVGVPAGVKLGHGLENVRARLAALYGSGSSTLHLMTRKGGGTIASVSLPAHTLPLDPAAPPSSA